MWGLLCFLKESKEIVEIVLKLIAQVYKVFLDWSALHSSLWSLFPSLGLYLILVYLQTHENLSALGNKLKLQMNVVYLKLTFCEGLFHLAALSSLYMCVRLSVTSDLTADCLSKTRTVNSWVREDSKVSGRCLELFRAMICLCFVHQTCWWTQTTLTLKLTSKIGIHLPQCVMNIIWCAWLWFGQ